MQKLNPEAVRKSELAMIHVAQNLLAQEDEVYCGILVEVTGEDSAAEVDAAGRKALIDHFKALGFEAAVKLAAKYGGMDHFDIPSAAAALRLVRNRAIVEKFSKWKSLWQLALEYALTERAVQKILAELGASADNRQAALF